VNGRFAPHTRDAQSFRELHQAEHDVRHYLSRGLRALGAAGVEAKGEVVDHKVAGAEAGVIRMLANSALSPFSMAGILLISKGVNQGP